MAVCFRRFVSKPTTTQKHDCWRQYYCNTTLQSFCVSFCSRRFSRTPLPQISMLGISRDPMHVSVPTLKFGAGGGSWNMLTKNLSVAIIIPYTVGHPRICYTWTEKTDASKASARPRFCGLYLFLAANPAPTRFLSMGPFCRQHWPHNAKNDDITQVFYLLLTKGWSF